MAPALLEKGKNLEIEKERGMRIRTQLRAGGKNLNHSEALRVRTTVKAGGRYLNHSEALRVRATLKAGGWNLNHNEALKRQDDREAISMRS